MLNGTMGYNTTFIEYAKGIFSNSVVVIFAMALITIINYGAFSMKQKIAILYSYAYVYWIAMLFKGEDHFIVVFVLLIASIFLYEEYLTDDAMKIILYKPILIKLIDCTYLLFRKYKIISIIIALYFLNNQSKLNKLSDIFMVDTKIIVSIIITACMLYAIHRMLTSYLEFNKISDVFATVIDKYPYYKFAQELSYQRDEYIKRIELLVRMEDRVFLKRKRTTPLNIEQLTLVLENPLPDTAKVSINQEGHAIKRFFKTMPSKLRNLFRGHSTIEMQLTRILLYKKGICYKRKNPFDWCRIIERKIFELIYTPIFIDSLRKYILKTTSYSDNDYKLYLAHIYLHTVLTWIGDRRNVLLASEFSDTNTSQSDDKIKSIHEWDMNELFVRLYGLKGVTIATNVINEYPYYKSIVDDEKFELKREEIEKLINDFKQPQSSKKKWHWPTKENCYEYRIIQSLIKKAKNKPRDPQKGKSSEANSSKQE